MFHLLFFFLVDKSDHILTMLVPLFVIFLPQALDLVQRSDGLRQAKDLALVQAEQAMEAALTMHPSPARDGLIKLASLVVNRTS